MTTEQKKSKRKPGSGDETRLHREWVCTDRDAIWCPVHGECLCARGRNRLCPLHGDSTNHPCGSVRK